MALQWTPNPRAAGRLSIAANQRARMASVFSIDWDHVTGKPDFPVLYQPLDSELTAIAGLTSAANKGLYFTGTATASTFDLTAVARTLLAQTTQASMRSTGLGLGTAATKDTGTSGTNVPLLDGANTWSASQTFSSAINSFGIGGAVSTSTSYIRLNGSSAASQPLVFEAQTNGTPRWQWGLMVGGTLDFAWYRTGSSVFAFRISNSDDSVLFGYSAKSNSPTGGVGYATGAGGTVTQTTSKSTGVTLNKVSGAITMDGAALAAGAIASFVLTNSAIAATDVLILNHISGGTPGSYSLNARCGNGSATIDVRNNTAGSLSEAIVIQYALIKAVNA